MADLAKKNCYLPTRLARRGINIRKLLSLLDEDSEEESEDEHVDGESKADKARDRILKRRTFNENNRNLNQLRAPVVCVLGKMKFYTKGNIWVRKKCKKFMKSVKLKIMCT